MNSYTFHINLYDLAFLGIIFIGLTFALLLWFTKRINQTANRFLALALVVMVLWMARILGFDIHVRTYYSVWNRLPLQFLLAFGPLLYFYVLKITHPEHKLNWKDLLHFAPALLEQVVFMLTNKLNPSLYFIAFISSRYLFISVPQIDRTLLSASEI